MDDYDLVIIGAGSANMLPTDAFARWRIAVVESDRFGGTCLNRGCIPSKMLVYSADVAQSARHAHRYGINATFTGADWPAIRERVFGRIDPLHAQAVRFRRDSGVDVHLGAARFVAPKVIDVDGQIVRGSQFVVAVGSRPNVPAITGLDTVDFHTSDTIMRVSHFPASLIVIGGGFIAAEMSHVFGGLGSRVTIVNRGAFLLGNHDEDIRRRFTERYADRFDVHLRADVDRVVSTRDGVAVEITVDGIAQRLEAETLLIATGRVPNSDSLNVAAGGLETDAHGHVVTDATYATNVPGVWALGDLANHFQLKHMANAEARLVSHNLLHPENLIHARFSVVPSAVFADPQVATVGATEQHLRSLGVAYAVGRSDYADTAYGWALEDSTSFAKVLADPNTRRLLGAHIIGPQASLLLQPLVQAMCLDNTVDQLAHDVVYIHPALSEVVEQALLDLDHLSHT